MRLRRANERNLLSAEQEAELAMIAQEASQQAAEPSSSAQEDNARELIEAIRSFGRIPKEEKRPCEERALAVRLRRARKNNMVSAEHEAELAQMAAATLGR